VYQRLPPLSRIYNIPPCLSEPAQQRAGYTERHCRFRLRYRQIVYVNRAGVRYRGFAQRGHPVLVARNLVDGAEHNVRKAGVVYTVKPCRAKRACPQNRFRPYLAACFRDSGALASKIRYDAAVIPRPFKTNNAGIVYMPGIVDIHGQQISGL
jgi:hypothetical protein